MGAVSRRRLVVGGDFEVPPVRLGASMSGPIYPVLSETEESDHVRFDIGGRSQTSSLVECQDGHQVAGSSVLIRRGDPRDPEP